MARDEIAPQDPAIELSDEELDNIAGGLNLRLTAARFHRSKVAFSQEAPASLDSGSFKTAFQAEDTESAILQLTVTDATTEDLAILGGLFGNATAIEEGSA